MIDAEVLVAFVLLNMGLALMPGPDVICILSNAVTHGAKAGLAVCAGIACGCLVHVTAVALGLSALLMAVPVAFIVVKTAGALYLVWLGWQLVRRPPNVAGNVAAGRQGSPFLQGALVNLLNPKIAIFFLAILPQFIEPANGNLGVQALVLGIVSIASGTAVNVVTTVLGASARRFVLTRERIMQRFQQTCGVILIGLGLRVALGSSR